MRLPSFPLTLITMGMTFGGIVFLQDQQIRVNAETAEATYRKQEEDNRLFLLVQSKMPRMGLENLWADWNYLRFIQYFGDTPARELTGYPLTPKFFEAVTDDDPRFIRAMLFLSTANTLFAASPQITVDLLNKAVARISPEFDPLTPYLWSYKGVDEMLFLGDIEGAKKSYQTAADWALKTNAPDKEAVAKRNQDTANFLATNPDSRKARVIAWMFILGSGINEQTQKLAVQNILALGGKVTPTPEGGLQVEFPEED